MNRFSNVSPEQKINLFLELISEHVIAPLVKNGKEGHNELLIVLQRVYADVDAAAEPLSEDDNATHYEDVLESVMARLKGVDERYRDFLGALGFVHRGLWESVVPDARGGAWGHLPLTFDAPLADDHDGMARMFDDAMRSRRPLALLGP